MEARGSVRAKIWEEVFRTLFLIQTTFKTEESMMPPYIKNLVRFIGQSLRQDPERVNLMTLSNLFIESLSLDFFMSNPSLEKADRQDALLLAQMFLQNDSELQMQDIFGYNLQGRDLLYKSQNELIWQGIEHIDSKSKEYVAELRMELIEQLERLAESKQKPL